jgi:uncharacterized protein (TIGR03435 family)
VLLVALIGSSLAAQTAPTSTPTFEVASIKRNISGSAGAAIRVAPAGQLSFTNVMLRGLIREAYRVDAYAESHRLDPGAFAGIIGRPGGGPQPDVPRFDVIAKPPAGSQPADRRAMTRELLEDRFKLLVRRQTRGMPVYAMRVAR